MKDECQQKSEWKFIVDLSDGKLEVTSGNILMANPVFWILIPSLSLSLSFSLSLSLPLSLCHRWGLYRSVSEGSSGA